MVLYLNYPVFCAKDLGFQLFKFLGYEPFRIYQRLLAHIPARNFGKVRPCYLYVISENRIVAYLKRRYLGSVLFFGFNGGKGALEDALVVAQWMSVFLRRSHVLKMACLAQLVNVIAPILTRRDGLVKQTIYYPFQLFRRFAKGTALDVLCQAPTYETSQFGAASLLDASASYDAESGASAVFIVNRSQQASEPVEIEWQNGAPGKSAHVYQVAGSDPKAANTFEQPNAVVTADLGEATLDGNKLTLRLPPLSFTVVSVG